jgi:hypothetical protein
VTHLNVAVEGDNLWVLSCGVSKDAEPECTSEASCWGYSIKDLVDAQAVDQDLLFCGLG